jgi:hypothetical protein
MCWFKKKKKESKKVEKWQIELSQEMLSKAKKDVLMFAMEESRLFLGKVSENTSRLINKGLVLLGITGGMIVFIVNTITWFIGLALTKNTLPSSGQIIYEQWPLMILIIFCFFCLVRACCILLKIVFPAFYYPLGSEPKDLLTEEVLGQEDIKEVFYSQMDHYQERINENVKQNDCLSDYVKESIRWIIIYPLVAIIIWAIIYLSLFSFC